MLDSPPTTVPSNGRPGASVDSPRNSGDPGAVTSSRHHGLPPVRPRRSTVPHWGRRAESPPAHGSSPGPPLDVATVAKCGPRPCYATRAALRPWTHSSGPAAPTSRRSRRPANVRGAPTPAPARRGGDGAWRPAATDQRCRPQVARADRGRLGAVSGILLLAQGLRLRRFARTWQTPGTPPQNPLPAATLTRKPHGFE
jgi:hypothetical protein